jgi:hypothetical protein
MDVDLSVSVMLYSNRQVWCCVPSMVPVLNSQLELDRWSELGSILEVILVLADAASRVPFHLFALGSSSSANDAIDVFRTGPSWLSPLCGPR